MFRISERELKQVERFLLGLGLALLGYVAWVCVDSAYVHWQFERQLAGVPHQVHQHDDARRLAPTVHGAPHRPPLPADAHADPVVTAPDADGFLGVLEVPRLGLSTVIFEGIDGKTLRRSVGHIPGTSFPGADGNVGIAGHRDRFFGGLKDLAEDDLMILRTPDASYTYRVDSIRIVAPDRTDVLEPTGVRGITLVTCYPFYFVGPAPERFVVFAHQIDEVKMLKPDVLPVPVSTNERFGPSPSGTDFEHGGGSHWAPHVPRGTMLSTGHPAFCSLSLPIRSRGSLRELFSVR